MNSLKTNIYFKLGTILFLTVILLIPTNMVRGLIDDRESTQEEAINEVSDKWANGQTLAGPFIVVPYDRYVERFNKKDSVKTLVKIKDYIQILPEQLKVNGTINPEKRYRGIYEVVVYDSKLKLSGTFADVDIKSLDIDPKHIHFDKASLNLGITDLKGIEKQISLDWNGETFNFNSGLSNKNIVSSGINTVLGDFKVDQQNRFELNIDLKGSQHLYFLPFGKTTDVNLASQWTTPSFNGEYLPDEREINEAGFTANWNVLHLNRNYPQLWKGSAFKVGGSSFGTDLLLPVDNYKKSDRVAKYAILFLGLTFLVFFFVEVLNKVFIHPVQYILVGLALVVFFTLLLSFSEHMAFNFAYIIAAVLTLCLVSLYSYAILKSKKLAGLIFGILLTLYLFIFIIIQLEDYALLIGSIGVFTILSIVMYYSRKIDWYELRLGEKPESIGDKE